MVDKILEFAREIAEEAGKILLNGFRSDDTIISYKSRTNLLTNIDKASEEFLFNSIRKKFPDHAVIAEEGSRKDSDGNYIWYVDPLDGTNNFAHGLPFFCVSLGVFSKKIGEIEAGVIYNPYLNEMFYAGKGTGSKLNGSDITVSESDNIGISILATGFPYEKENIEKNNLKEFNRFLPRIQGIRRMGSAAMDLSYIACGRLDGYWEGFLESWDMAAGSLIVKEAGGCVTNYSGGKFDPEYPQIVASNGKIHNSIIKVLSELN